MRREKVTAGLITAIIIIIFCSCVMRIVVKNLFYEGLHIENAFISFILKDDEDIYRQKHKLNEEENKKVDFSLQYPFDEEDQSKAEEKKGNAIEDILNIYKAKTDSFKVKIQYYADNIIFKNDITSEYMHLKKVTGFDLVNGNSDTNQIFMKNGYLANVEPLVTNELIEEDVENIIKYRDFLEERGIPFLYINAASKVNPYDKEIDNYSIENSNENGDMLMKRLSEEGVDHIDFREEILSSDYDWYELFYKTDHHWTNKAGLWAASVIADKLNEDYGFNFSKKYYDIDNYRLTHYDKYWLGGSGRCVSLLDTGLEDFDMLIPDFETGYTVDIPTIDYHESGSYEDVLLRKELFDNIADYETIDYYKNVDAYHCVKTIFPYIEIQNELETNNKGKSILILHDSFGWWLTPYLARDVDKITKISLSKFNGSMKTYIEKNKPDIVIMMYCERQIPWTEEYRFK
ncbi:MAG: hypothetical protein K5931_01285 [Lachnospiraceae bacterium]|nr:hypothetical protein [Lachnospiraceae bacterium]